MVLSPFGPLALHGQPYSRGQCGPPRTSWHRKRGVRAEIRPLHDAAGVGAGLGPTAREDAIRVDISVAICAVAMIAGSWNPQGCEEAIESSWLAHAPRPQRLEYWIVNDPTVGAVDSRRDRHISRAA